MNADASIPNDRKVQEQRYLRARKCLIWANICMTVGVITIFFGGLLFVIAAVFLYRKRKKILAEGPVFAVTKSLPETLRENKLLFGGVAAAMILMAMLISSVSTGDAMATAKFDEAKVRERLVGTFYARGQRIKNSLYGKIAGQIEYQDFSNYTYYISLSSSGKAMTIADSKEGDYGGVQLPGGVAMRNASYDLGKTAVRQNGKDVEVWKISFDDAPAPFPEKELIVCEKGFRTISGVYGNYDFTKKDGTVLTNRSEVAKYFHLSEK